MRTLTVWDTRHATPIQTIGPLTGRVQDLAIAADDTTAQGAIRDAAFTPDGDRPATTDGSVVYLWDARHARPVGEFEGVTGTGGATSLSVSPDGKLLAVADLRRVGPVLDILRLPRLQLVRQVSVPTPARIQFSHDGKGLLLGDQGGHVWLLDTRSWRPLGAPLARQSSPGPFAVDPGGRLLATTSTDGSVQLARPPL
jgi:WD40 repeat protein